MTAKHPIDRLDQCRFKVDILRLAIAGLDDKDLAHPEDALASLGWLATTISVELSDTIKHMEDSNI
jgi:hypothetical protein